MSLLDVTFVSLLLHMNRFFYVSCNQDSSDKLLITSVRHTNVQIVFVWKKVLKLGTAQSVKQRTFCMFMHCCKDSVSAQRIYERKLASARFLGLKVFLALKVTNKLDDLHALSDLHVFIILLCVCGSVIAFKI